MTMKTQLRIVRVLVGLATLIPQLSTCCAQGTAFIYQGRLGDGGTPATGSYDFRFAIYDALSGGTAVGGPLTNSPVAVSNGLFNVTLDFGAGVFNGDARWLDIGVRTNGSEGDFTPLAPRQSITATPYAITAGNVTGTLPEGGLFGAYTNKVAFTHPANSFTGDGAGLTNVNAATLGGLTSNQFWKTAGNSGTSTATDFLGTTDNQPLLLRVNNTRVMRLEVNGLSPNIIGGFLLNNASTGVVGATISGGGGYISAANSVAADYATISGGSGHSAGGFASAIGGGENNNIGSNASHAVISGGVRNLVEANADGGAIGGGENNRIGRSATAATIGGGFGNFVEMNTTGNVIGGGQHNVASSNTQHSIIGGGLQNKILAGATYVTIGGGQGNTIENLFDGTIGGGAANTIARGADYATIGGGLSSRIETNASRATIAGGDNNEIGFGGLRATIGGGWNNAIEPGGGQSTIGGGGNNRIGSDATYGTISGGAVNTIESFANYATIGGGLQNRIQISSGSATIGGGFDNEIQNAAAYATINGGQGNGIQSGAASATIGGGFRNIIQTNAADATVGGGSSNVIASGAVKATIGGGTDNLIEFDTQGATIAGGQFNSIERHSIAATIGGGSNNVIAFDAVNATIGGGAENTIVSGADYCNIGGGQGNRVGGKGSVVAGGSNNVAVGSFAVVAGGQDNLAVGDYSFAAGRRAYAVNNGSFVWADSNDFDFRANFANGFFARSTGGVVFVTGIDGTGESTAGVYVPPGSSAWRTWSDRDSKTNLAPVNPREVLERLVAIPVQTWNWKAQDPAIRHIGPVAQDFFAAFNVGEDDKHISTVDADGVALAAIQGLNQKFEEREALLREELKRRDAENAELKARLEKLEQRLNDPLNGGRSK
jgi:trimeric autotransporter adhesin